MSVTLDYTTAPFVRFGKKLKSNSDGADDGGSKHL
jgi:hypothetical protein